MARYSEEQKKDMMFKLQIGVLLAVLGSIGYGLGPGLPKFLEHARKNKDKPWAPTWYLRVGRLMEATFREPQAREVYDEFYLNWSGDESQLTGLDSLEEYYKDAYDPKLHRWLWPAVATRYNPDSNPRPAWIGGEGAKPHPMLAEVLMRVVRMHEGERDYGPVRHMYKAVLAVFPPDCLGYKQAEEARKRDAGRSF